MQNDLKPCKYCGSKAILVRVGDWKEFLLIDVLNAINIMQDIVKQD